MANGPSKRLLTPEFRMSFAKLINAEAFQSAGKPKGEPKFTCECILPPEALVAFKEDVNGDLVDVDVRKVFVALGNEKWPGGNLKEMASKNQYFWPFTDGDKYAVSLAAKAEKTGKTGKNYDHYKGQTVFKIGANEEYPPVLSYKDSGKLVLLNRGLDSDMAKAKQLFSGGNYAIAEVTAKADDSPMGPYLKLYVNRVRFTRVGERLGGGNSMMDRFDGISGGESDHNPAEGLDDQIPY